MGRVVGVVGGLGRCWGGGGSVVGHEDMLVMGGRGVRFGLGLVDWDGGWVKDISRGGFEHVPD